MDNKIIQVKLHDHPDYSDPVSIGLEFQPKNNFWYDGDDSSPIHIFCDRKLEDARKIDCQKKIAWINETPEIYEHCESTNKSVFNPFKYIEENRYLFDYILSPYTRLAHLVDEGHFLWFPTTMSHLRREHQIFWEKSRLISIVASFKNWTSGHLLRHKIVKLFHKKLDVYGNAYNNLIDQYGVGGKIIALASYYFTICVSNCKEDDYFSEIVTDACSVGTIPIFWGTDNIGKYLNADGIITFDTIEELSSIMDSLSIELYYSKLDAIFDNMRRSIALRSGFDWAFTNYYEQIFSL